MIVFGILAIGFIACELDARAFAKEFKLGKYKE